MPMELNWHLVFSTSNAALAGYAQSFRAADVQLELFRYSEQDGLEADALGAEFLLASEVTVLLLATPASSYLWFDPEHYPRNVELCTILKTFPDVRVNFIVCPTTESARDGWQQHSSDLRSIFRDFLPETGRVDTWMDFDPDQDLEHVQIHHILPSFNQREGFHAQRGNGLVRRPFWKLSTLILLVAVGLIQFLVAAHEAMDKMIAQTEAKYKTHKSKMAEIESWSQSDVELESAYLG